MAERKEDDVAFCERLEAMNQELEMLNAEVRELEGHHAENSVKMQRIG